MWALLRALFKRNLVLLVTTSNLKLINAFNISSKPICFGLPWSKASIFTGKLVCNLVCLHNWLRTTSPCESLLISTTILIPFLSDSSLKSDIPSIVLSLTNSPIFSKTKALLTWKGISVIIITSLSAFLPVRIISALDRIITLPLPVLKASLIPDLPIIKAAVGKSGPGIISINSSKLKSGLSIRALHALITSPGLWGGIFVAIPTAIPPAPLTSIFGNSAGRTDGSDWDSS